MSFKMQAEIDSLEERVEQLEAEIQALMEAFSNPEPEPEQANGAAKQNGKRGPGRPRKNG